MKHYGTLKDWESVCFDCGRQKWLVYKVDGVALCLICRVKDILWHCLGF